MTEIVYMDDATLEQITHLVAWLGTDQRQIASDVWPHYKWTEGDVYPTHKLCAGLARDIPEGAILLADVDRAARRHLYEDEMFRKMWTQIRADPDASTLIDTLLEHREPVRFTLLQRHIMIAWLEGAIKADNSGYCVLHSLVHESVFYSMHRNNSTPKAVHPHIANLHDSKMVLRSRYLLIDVLHPGLTSYVYRATDQITGEKVAVKQLMVSRELNEMAWHRFQRESDALRRLSHPNIVRFIHAFHESDFEYIVMEYVFGGSLFDRLNREGRLSLAQALDIAVRIASALDHAHSKGIIHRVSSRPTPCSRPITRPGWPILASPGSTIIPASPCRTPSSAPRPISARKAAWAMPSTRAAISGHLALCSLKCSLERCPLSGGRMM